MNIAVKSAQDSVAQAQVAIKEAREKRAIELFTLTVAELTKAGKTSVDLRGEPVSVRKGFHSMMMQLDVDWSQAHLPACLRSSGPCCCGDELRTYTMK